MVVSANWALPADELLLHGTPRLVYGVRLAHNVREYLLGIDKRPRYILSQDDPIAASGRIGIAWIERWMLRRIKRDDVIERVARHNFVHPVRHGARVVLPRADLEQQVLFDESEDDRET